MLQRCASLARDLSFAPTRGIWPCGSDLRTTTARQANNLTILSGDGLLSARKIFKYPGVR